ncbi:hypothetical protein [Acidisoma sp. 7E03]
MTENLTTRQDQGRELVLRAGAVDVPPEFDGAALLEDIEEADFRFWLCLDDATFRVIQADLDAFDEAIASVRKARAKLQAAMVRFYAGEAIRSGLVAIRADGPRPKSENGLAQEDDASLDLGSLRRQLRTAHPSVLMAILMEGMQAIIAAAPDSRKQLEHWKMRAPLIRAEDLPDNGTPQGRLLGQDLPSIFEKHLKISCRYWEDHRGPSLGAKLVNEALCFLKYEPMKVEALRKAASAYKSGGRS